MSVRLALRCVWSVILQLCSCAADIKLDEENGELTGLGVNTVKQRVRYPGIEVGLET
jgi:hypothetical protein